MSVPDQTKKPSQNLEAELAALKAEVERLRLENARLSAQQSMQMMQQVTEGPIPSRSQRPELALMITNLLDEFLFYKNEEGVYLFVNNAFAKNYGLTPDELIGKTDAELIGKDLANKFGADDKIVYQSGETLRKETVVRHSEGYYDLIQTIKFPVFNRKSEVIGIVGTARDISEFKQREKKLSNNLDDIASHAQQLNLLYRLAEKMSRSKAIHEAYQLIAQNTPLITRSDGCSITLLNDDGKSLDIFLLDSSKGVVDTQTRIQIGDWELTKAISEQRLVVIDNTQPAEVENLKGVLGTKLQTAMIAPLIAREKVIGTLNIMRNRDLKYTPWEKQLLVQLANTLAITAENIHLLLTTKNQLALLQKSQKERENLLTEIEESKRFMVDIVDSIPVPIYVKDQVGRFIMMNQAYRDNIIPPDSYEKSDYARGYTIEKGDWMGKSVLEIIGDPEKAQKYHSQDMKLLAHPGIQRYEIDMGFADDSRRDVIFYKATYNDNMGEVAGLVGTILDISEEKEAERKILQREEELRNILSKLPIAVAIINTKQVIYVNDETCKLFKGTREELHQISPTQLYFNQADQQRIFSDFANSTGPLSVDLNLKALNGDPLWVNLSMYEIYHSDEAVTLAVLYDLTRRRQTENLLIQAKEDAEAASRMKSEFLSNMSHELRTPMNGVLGMTSLLQNTELDQEQQEIVKTIRNSGNTLLTIISEILDFSKIEAGKLEIEPISHMVRTTVEESIDLIASKAQDKGLTVVYFLDPAIPQWIIQDVTRIRQILANLLSNAVKFTEDGHIAVHIDQIANNPLVIRFTVKDTGIGIPENRIDRLFQSFSQVDASTTRRFGGTGLGLAISKRLAELMGGEMWVESTIGEGSAFRFTVQAEIDSSKENRILDPSIAQVFEKKQVLIIDQVEESSRALKEMVESMGVITHNIDLDMLLLSQSSLAEYNGIVIDRETYLDLSDKVKQYIVRASQTDTLLFLNQLGQKMADLLVESRHVLTKPVKFKQLKDTLNSIFTGEERRRQTGRLKTFNRDMAEENPLRILLAEDNVVNQKVALGLLSRHGYSADLAANGREALEALARQTYDVILMDVNMPEIDGIEASKRIRNNPLITPQPYIIALTANAFQEDKKELLENGLMNDYVSKPVSVERLLEALMKVPRVALEE